MWHHTLIYLEQTSYMASTTRRADGMKKRYRNKSPTPELSKLAELFEHVIYSPVVLQRGLVFPSTADLMGYTASITVISI